MSSGLELVAGALVALATLYLVLEPLFRMSPVRRDIDESELFDDVEEDESPKVRALLALKEIEFDRATGKLSDEDYVTLKKQYSARVLEALDEESDGGSEPVDPDPAEGIILEARCNRSKEAVCPTCGPRLEAGAIFCSTCGSRLAVRRQVNESPVS